jgi:hypothetical protein
MRICNVILSTVALVGCATPLSAPIASSPGQQLSSNLLKVHEAYCNRSPESNQRLAELKVAGLPYRVIDRKTGEASKVWVAILPKTETSGILTQWGFAVKEPANGGSCGVMYLEPEQLEALKSGYMP